HQKTMHRAARLRTDDRDGDHNGIGTHGQSADSLRLPAPLLEKFQKNAAGQLRPLGIQRGGAAVNVVIALDAGSESEFTETKGILGQQSEQLVARGWRHVFHIRNRMLIFSQIGLPVISTEHEEAKRLSASGETPRMFTHDAESGSSPRALSPRPQIQLGENTVYRHGKGRNLGVSPLLLGLPLCGIPRSRSRRQLTAAWR